MLLMFGVGLHFSLDDLLFGETPSPCPARWCRWPSQPRWRRWRTPGAGTPGAALVLASRWRLPAHRGAAALSGQGRNDIGERHRIAVGWLVVEDLMVLALVLLPALARCFGPGGSGNLGIDGICGARWHAMLAVAAFVALHAGGGHRLFPRLLWQVARTGSRATLHALMRGGPARDHRLWLGQAVRRPSRSAPSPAWCCANRVQPPRRRGIAAAAGPSRCCSSSQWACCSTRASSSGRCRCWPWWRQSWSGKSFAAGALVVAAALPLNTALTVVLPGGVGTGEIGSSPSSRRAGGLFAAATA